MSISKAVTIGLFSVLGACVSSSSECLPNAFCELTNWLNPDKACGQVLPVSLDWDYGPPRRLSFSSALRRKHFAAYGLVQARLLLSFPFSA
jgi:hypothetical protein